MGSVTAREELSKNHFFPPNSCKSKKLATNELPLEAEESQEPTSPTTFEHPLSISENAELDTNDVANDVAHGAPHFKVPTHNPESIKQ